MTAVTNRSFADGFASVLGSAAARVVEVLALIANSSALLREVERLNATSDESLAERGTTRTAEVDRIFAARHY